MAGVVLAAMALSGCGSGEPTAAGQSPGDAASTTPNTYVCVPAAIESCGTIDTVASISPDPAAAGPDGCGLEVNVCGSGVNPSPSETALAECTTESFQEAVVANIDAGSFTVVDPQCDGTWAAFTVDRSRGACPASDEPQPGCTPGTRAHRTFWRNAFGHWVVITYGGTGDCAEVRAVAPDFPEAICAG